MKPARRQLLQLMAGAAVLPAAPRVVRAQTYPTRPITIIVPFAPGGGTDVSARVVGEHMSRTLGQQFVVENFPGAGGTTGSIRAMRAIPDGYTIEMGHIGTHAVSVWLYPQLAYKPDVDFEPIGLAMETPLVIVARKDFPPRNLEEFIAYVKANSEKLNMGHAGVGSILYSFGLMGRPRVRCLPARLTTRVVRPWTLLPTFSLGHSRPMQSQQTNAALPCQMSQPPRKLDSPNSRPCPGLPCLHQRAHHDRFWINLVMHSTRPWMIKKFAIVFLTWVVTFLTKQGEASKHSGRWSKTRLLAGRRSSRRRTLVGNETVRRGLSMSALPPKADMDQRGRDVRFGPILLQKSAIMDSW
jgi:Tripartite tricarboxylate transporter family receptor